VRYAPHSSAITRQQPLQDCGDGEDPEEKAFVEEESGIIDNWSLAFGLGSLDLSRAAGFNKGQRPKTKGQKNSTMCI
jgi:hypothetical protein